MIRSKGIRLAGRYELQALLASKGGRQVWRALDLGCRRPVVVKGAAGSAGLGAVGSVEQEYLRSRALRHPRIVRALDFGRCSVDSAALLAAGGLAGFAATEVPPVDALDTYHFFTQPLLQGRSLLELRGRLTIPQVERCVGDLLELIAFLHARGLNRLDLKSAHLILASGTWYLIDLDEVRPDDPLGPAELHGTLAWLAPEVVAGQVGGPEADLYSAGVLLYEALTGQCPPLEGGSLEQIAAWLNDSSVPSFPETARRQAPALVDLGQRLLARDPLQRPSAEEALEALGRGRFSWRVRAPLGDGRLLERRAILDRLELLRSGASPKTAPTNDDTAGGAAAALEGPRGSGATRLLEEACARWQLAGVPAVYIDAAELQGSPLATLRLAATLLSLIAGEAAADGPLKSPGEPRWTGASISAEDATAAGGAEALIQLELERLCQAGREAARVTGGPVPVLLDHTGALDALSRQVLERLVPYIETSGLLLVAAVNDTPTTPEAGADALVDRPLFTAGVVNLEDRPLSSADSALHRLRLEALSPEAVRTLAEELLKPEVLDAAVLEALIRASEGRPAAVHTRLAMHWRDPAVSWETLITGPAGTLGAAPGLAPDLRRVLQCASIPPGPFPLTLLETLLQELDPGTAPTPSGDGLDVAVEALLARGLLVRAAPAAEQHGHLRFAGEALRQEVEAGLPAQMCRRLHAAAARFLEHSAAFLEELPAEVMSRHYLAAGEPAQALPYLRRAVSAATAGCRYAEAARWLRAWLEAVPEQAASRGVLHRRLGEVELELEHAEAARDAFTAALEDPRLDAWSWRQARAGRARALIALGRLSDARQDLEAALDDAPPGASETARDAALAPAIPEVPEAVRWRHRLVWVLLSLHHLEAAREVLAAAGAGAALEPGLRVEHLCYLGWWAVEASAGQDAAAADLYEAARLARSQGHLPGLLMALNLVARLEQARHAYEAARLALEEGISIARARFDLAREAAALANLARVLQILGDPSTALAHLERAGALQAHLGNASLQALNLMAGVDMMLEVRNLIRAESLIGRLEPLVARLEAGDPARAWLEISSCRLRMLQGRSDGLEPRLEAAYAWLLTAGRPNLALEAALARLELLLQRSALDEGAVLLGEAETLAGQVDTPAVVGRLHALAARYHTLRAAASSDGRRAPAVPPEIAVGAPGDAHGRPDASSPREMPLIRMGVVELLDSVTALVRRAHDEADLAVGLARLAGELIGGRGLVVLNRKRRPRVVRGYRITAPDAMDISRRVLKRVLSSGEGYECHDVARDDDLSLMKSLTRASVRSVMCVPILEGSRCVGALYLDHPERGWLMAAPVREAVTRMARFCSELLEVHLKGEQEPEREIPVLEGFIGDSPAARELRRAADEIRQYAGERPTVLLLGPTGSGKTELARIIHTLCGRKSFVRVGCANLQEDTFESDFVGNSKDAFTGVGEKAGFLLEAQGGTLFLDEVHTLSPASQNRLLTLLDDAEFHRLGDRRKYKLDILLICASTEDLDARVEAGRFREELVARLDRDRNRIYLPSLRERGRQDIEALARHQLRSQLRLGADTPLQLEDHFTPPALRFLYEYEWPKNVRELLGVLNNKDIRKCLANRQKVSLNLLKSLLQPPRATGTPEQAPALSLPPPGMSWQSLQEYKMRMTKAYLEREVQRRHNKSLTAREMGLSRTLLHRILRWKPGEPLPMGRNDDDLFDSNLLLESDALLEPDEPLDLL